MGIGVCRESIVASLESPQVGVSVRAYDMVNARTAIWYAGTS